MTVTATNVAVANILNVYAQATDYEIKEGAEWYTGDAWAFCLNMGWQVAAHLGQLTQEIGDRHYARFAAAVVAVMSPQKEWRVNKALADAAIKQVVSGETVTGHYEAQCKKVEKLYRYFLLNRGVAFNNDDVLNIISKSDSQKTRCFYMNITGNHLPVTVDGHAASIVENGLKRVSITQTKQPKGRKYEEYAAAYIVASQFAGVSPAVMQAITWVTYRRMGLVVK